MKNRLELFVDALLDRIDAFTLVSTALDCIPRHLLRFADSNAIHIYPNPDPGDNHVTAVCEVFSDEGVVEYMGVTERNGCICIVRGKVEELPDSEVEKIMQAVVQDAFAIATEDASPSLVAWRAIAEHFTQEVANYAELNDVVRAYPDKVVGAWASDYDTQMYLEDCRKAEIEEDE